MKIEGWIVAACLITLVVLINLGLIKAYISRKPKNQARSISRAFHRIRNPWKDEDDQIRELSQRVANLKYTQGSAENKKEPPESD